MAKRLFDIFFSLVFILLFSPLFLIIMIFIVIESQGGAFYRQVRVGKSNRDFKIFKFRTMRVGAEKGGLLTVGGRDPRVTRVGYYLRRYKLDELPQLFNVLLNDMSFVGPRPEVRRYVEMYNDEQKRVLLVKPGITDPASISYIDENEILSKADDPEATYIKEVMPAKLAINLAYLNRRSFFTDLGVLF
ncbi:MAG TPA: sugar transferase, partial [Bacteroidales bacterium]|nr:sugar transferase [Bacteroidales bacterium]